MPVNGANYRFQCSERREPGVPDESVKFRFISEQSADNETWLEDSSLGFVLHFPEEVTSPLQERINFKGLTTFAAYDCWVTSQATWFSVLKRRKSGVFDEYGASFTSLTTLYSLSTHRRTLARLEKLPGLFRSKSHTCSPSQHSILCLKGKISISLWRPLLHTSTSHCKEVSIACQLAPVRIDSSWNLARYLHH